MADSRSLQPEQDVSGNGDLPTYDALAAEAGPNSRFGRWRSWVEKRAAERYVDLTPEVLARRRARGWGEDILDHGPSRTSPQLRVQTEALIAEPPNYATPSVPSNPSSVPPPITGELLAPSHLCLGQFGSRFLPHSTAPIRCVLPLLADRFVLIGHDDGLSMLNMFPKEWTEDGLSDDGPAGAQARVIWEGEAVYQLTLLEVDYNGTDAPTGVVLALVGSCREDELSSKDVECTKSLRMYSLSSIISLIKWAASSKYVKPLQVRGSTPGNPHRGSTRKGHHKPQLSITKGLKSQSVDNQAQALPYPFCYDPPPSVHSSSGISPSTTSVNSIFIDEFRGSMSSSTPTQSLDSIEEAWDIVEDLPLRWTSDYVSLAISGSRLANTSVLFYDIWSDPTTTGRKGALLAVATKSTILIYETPKEERAFRFVKEFYIPSPPRAMRFVYQSISDPISRSASDAGSSHRARSSPSKLTHHHLSHYRSTSSGTASIRYSNQLSLFVLFEKKAGIIRISDASVGEVELSDDGPPAAFSVGVSLTPSASVSSSTLKRNRASWDGFGFIKEKPTWTLPTHVELSSVPSTSVYLLTRSKRTHIIPAPLPADLPSTPSFQILTWTSVPKHVEARVCRPYAHEQEGHPPFLQLIAFGEDGIEVQEINLNQLTVRKGKGKGVAIAPTHAVSDILGGETAPLCVGGHWHRPVHPDQTDLFRTDSVMSYMSASSYDSNDTEELAAKFMSERGIYGWVRKGYS
ncbi:hypothetical protein BDM02DRAFT_3110114, partial [Thelephora ganbajun]